MTQSNNTGLDFGTAIKAMKQGKLIARSGWNGKGMHVFLTDQNIIVTKDDEYIGKGLPYMVLKTASGALQPGWNASTPDVLAEDWCVLD